MHSRHEDIKNIEVEIRRVDYGDLICLSLWKIRELCEEVAKVPAQALQVSLTDVGVIISFHNMTCLCFNNMTYDERGDLFTR